jgi:membrane-associated protease RseP (regulator of RpoE activity)
LRQATGLLETAEAELKQPERTWRATALLQGVAARWGKTEAGEKARRLLDEIQGDPRRLERLAAQGGAEERRMLSAQARGFEKLGDYRRAVQANQLLVRNHAETPEGKKAADELKRLALVPYLGVAFAADAARVVQVLAHGPADLAGVKSGDIVVKMGEAAIGSPQDLRRVLQTHKAGEKVALEVQRGGKPVLLEVELGTLPADTP